MAYEQSKLPFDTPRKIKIILTGVGVSGSLLLMLLKVVNCPMSVCREKNDRLGGTWLENRYPVCACGIPSDNYLVCLLKSFYKSLGTHSL